MPDDGNHPASHSVTKFGKFPLVATPVTDGRRFPWRNAWLEVPETGWVTYVILARDGEALYVGQSRAPRRRLQEHQKNSYGRWFHRAAAILVFPALDEADARIGEYLLHRELRPTHSRIARGERTKMRQLIEAEFHALPALAASA